MPSHASGVRNHQLELAHVPRRRRTALGAEAAVQAHILVLHHDALRLRQRGGRRKSPASGSCAGAERCVRRSKSSRVSGAIVRQFTGQTSTHASHSMQSFALKCVSMSQLRQRSTSAPSARREAELDLDVQALEALRQLGVLHLRARRRAVVVAVAPRVHADLRADEVHPVRGALGRAKRPGSACGSRSPPDVRARPPR